MEAVKERYQQQIDNLDQVSSLPTIISKVLKVVNHPRSAAEDVAWYIEKDIGLASKVLKMANSSYYGIPKTIGSVHSSVVILGFNTLKSIVLSTSVKKLFPDESKVPHFNLKKFWKHSIEVAMISKYLAKVSSSSIDDEIAFSSGLLHEVGLLVIDQFSPEAFVEVIDMVQKESCTLVAAEERTMGITHLTINKMLFDKWGLPEALSTPIHNHMTLNESIEHRTASYILHLANHISYLRGSFCIEKEPVPPLNEETFEVLGIDQTMDGLMGDIATELENFSEVFSLIYSG
ncbi:MAG: HDOD domain-containing protein [Fibrobacterales bacterium]